MMNIDDIKKLINEQKIIWRDHILIRMQQRGIKIKDVIECITSGEIVECYLDDYPYPSCLILGYTNKRTGMHVVCAAGQNKIWMITAYYPDENEWYEDLKTRRK